MSLRDTVKGVVHSNKFWVAVTAALSATGGIAVGMELGQRKAETKFQALLTEEIEKTKLHYSALHKKDDFATPEQAVARLIPEAAELKTNSKKAKKDAPTITAVQAADALINYQSMSKDETYVAEDGTLMMREVQGGDVEVEVEVQESETEPKTEVDVKVNIFDRARASQGVWDYEQELLLRAELSPEEPYIISRDEYMANETTYEQTTLTYYAGDDILSDDQDKPVEDSERTVGNLNLQRFGHGSKDPKMVYIRNDRMEMDFEVLHDDGKFAELVHGYIEHSDSRKNIGKFRGGYD